MSAKNKNLLPIILVTCLFFLWGFAHNLDSILIPHLKKACQLNNRLSTLVDTSVFMAYFLMAIPAGMIMKKWGYKTGIVTGLLLFATGAFLFVPAANTQSFLVFISALFIIGTGLTMLETAGNPYATVLGSPETATTRLNFMQSFNGLAAMIAPVIGGTFILSGKEYTADQLSAMSEAQRVAYYATEASAVKMPYIILGVVLVLIALLIVSLKLPEIKTDNEKQSLSNFAAAWKHKHLKGAVIAQFFYVGAQVCVTSFFIRAAKSAGGVDEITAAKYLGWGYGLAFMLGRFVGTGFMRKIAPKNLLALYALLCMLLSLIAIYATGMIVIYALVGLGFFMSIMFPTIFSLGIQGLGKDTKAGSSLIVMSVAGGAILPFCMGVLIDKAGDNIQFGYVIPLVCYGAILLFARRKTALAGNGQIVMQHP